MLVKWNETRLKVISDNAGKAVVTLYPGTNEVADELWNQVRPALVMDLKLNRMEEVEATPKTVKGEEGDVTTYTGKTLKDLKVQDAVAAINACNSLELLNAWMDAETREGVRPALFKRIEFLEKAK